MEQVRILGAGPAGGAAALAALAVGARVEIYEKSRFPRHKVCGEFLSPQAAVVLERLGMWGKLQAEAAPMRRMVLTFGGRERRASLPETAWGLSRRRLDELLLAEAQARGATFFRELGQVGPGRTVVATGRQASAPKGGRLFGFKAHFTGECSDTVELNFLSNGAYVGVSPVEGGYLNVCGIVHERDLKRFGFEIDAWLEAQPGLAARLRPLRRAWDWLYVGPVVFRRPADLALTAGVYPCGDAMGFVDPFTGSGILSALLTGTLAGEAAAQSADVTRFQADCCSRLYPAYLASQVFRKALGQGWARYFVPWVPLGWLFGLTRPRV